MMYASAIANTCDVDLITLQNKLDNLKIKASSQQEMIQTLMSDQYYDKVNDLYNMIKNVDANKLDCVMKTNIDGSKNSVSPLCSSEIVSVGSTISDTDISHLTMIVDKYQDILANVVSQMYNIVIDAQKLCNNDSKLERLKKLISKLALFFVDNETLTIKCNSIMPKNNNVSQENSDYISNYTLAMIILVCIVLALLYNLSNRKR